MSYPAPSEMICTFTLLRCCWPSDSPEAQPGDGGAVLLLLLPLVEWGISRKESMRPLMAAHRAK